MALPLVPIAIGGLLLLMSKKKSPQQPPNGGTPHDNSELPVRNDEGSHVDPAKLIGTVGGIVATVVPIAIKVVAGLGGTAATVGATATVTGTVTATATGGATAAAATDAATVAAAAGLSSAAAGGIVFAVIVVVIVATIIIAYTVAGYNEFKEYFSLTWLPEDQMSFVQSCMYGDRFYAGGVWQYENDKRGIMAEIKAITDDFTSVEVADVPDWQESNKYLPRRLVFEAK